MHASVTGFGRRELAEQGAGVLRVREVVHRSPHRLARGEDVGVGERLAVRTGLREEVAAEEGPGGGLEGVPALPAVGEVRGVEPPDAVLAERELLAVAERPRRPHRLILDRRERGDEAARRGRGRRCPEELVQRAALVGLVVRERDPPEPLHRQHRGDGLAREREDAPRPGVEQERLVVCDEVLVEAEAARDRHGRGRQGGADAVDARCDLVHPGSGLRVRDHGGRGLGTRSRSRPSV